MPGVAENAPKVHHVFIISFDQGNPDLIEKSDMPVFHQMVSEGAHTWEAYTVVPSLTLPSHTSMLTGVGVQKHQVLWNDYEPEKGVVKLPTIFQHRQRAWVCNGDVCRQGEIQARIDLPGSVDDFVWPRPEDDAKAVAKAFASAVGQSEAESLFHSLPRS